MPKVAEGEKHRAVVAYREPCRRVLLRSEFKSVSRCLVISRKPERKFQLTTMALTPLKYFDFHCGTFIFLASQNTSQGVPVKLILNLDSSMFHVKRLE